MLYYLSHYVMMYVDIICYITYSLRKCNLARASTRDVTTYCKPHQMLGEQTNLRHKQNASNDIQTHIIHLFQ